MIIETHSEHQVRVTLHRPITKRRALGSGHVSLDQMTQ